MHTPSLPLRLSLPFAFVCLLGLASLAAAQTSPATWTPPEPPPGMPAGMAYYTVVLLERGSGARPADTKPIMDAHLAHMTSLHEQGWLVAAGPIADTGTLRGIWILRGVSPDDSVRLADADPSVKAGLIAPRVLEWWGPAGIGEEYKAWRKANRGAPDRMRTYQFGVLASGPARTATPTSELEALQKAHMAHIVSLAEQGVLVAAGPLKDAGDDRGLFVFATDSMESARALGDADPMVKAGHLALHLWPWMVAEGVLPAPQKAK